VAALAAVNAVGSVASSRTGRLYGAEFGLPGEFDWLRAPSAGELRAGAELLADRPVRPPLNTTIGVVATSAPLTKAQCGKLAGAGQDGLARAIRPAHTMFDGDTVFGLSTGSADRGDLASPWLFYDILAAAADCFSRAVVYAVLAATSTKSWPSYLDAFPSVAAKGL
jgi:L-aminopeptidase/D-esterase-like protein